MKKEYFKKVEKKAAFISPDGFVALAFQWELQGIDWRKFSRVYWDDKKGEWIEADR